MNVDVRVEIHLRSQLNYEFQFTDFHATLTATPIFTKVNIYADLHET